MAFTLHASGAETANGATSSLDILSQMEGVTANPNGVAASVIAQLVVTAKGGTSPTLDVLIEESLDDSNWYTLVAFTRATAETNEIKKATEAGRYLRASWTIGGTDTPTFTFAVILDYKI